MPHAPHTFYKISEPKLLNKIAVLESQYESDEQSTLPLILIPQPNFQYLTTNNESLIASLRNILARVPWFLTDKNLKDMVQGINSSKKISLYLTASCGEVVNAKFTIINGSNLIWPDAYLLSKKSETVPIANEIFAIKLSPQEQCEFTVSFKAPEQVGTYTGKYSFYYYNGENAFVTFGRGIKMVLNVITIPNRGNALLECARHLCEKEKIGTLEQWLYALTICNGNAEQAKQIIYLNIELATTVKGI
jgi:hypothetical protein